MAGEKIRHLNNTHSKQHSALIHPIVTLLLPLLKNQSPRLLLQPLLTSRQIQEVPVSPPDICDFDFLRFSLLGDHVRRGNEIQCVSKIRFSRDRGESLERILAKLGVLLLSSSFCEFGTKREVGYLTAGE